MEVFRTKGRQKLLGDTKFHSCYIIWGKSFVFLEIREES